jgi:3'-phosphoadenosine 5'-phosphosulfate sulfotransferase
MTYELWNIRARSLVGGFDTQAEALACVREAIRRHGRDYVDVLLLGAEDRRGRSKPIARGQALATLALEDGAAPVGQRTPVPA